jgi:MFS family permease
VVAGMLIAIEPIGIGGVYFLGAALALLSVISAAGLPAGDPRGSSGRTPFGDMADGINYVRRRPELTRLLTIGILVVMFGFPHVTFLPGLIQDIYELDAWALGVLTGSAAIGAVSSSLFLANVATKRLTSLQFRAGLTFAIALAIFAAVPNYWGGVVIMVAVGAASSAYQAVNNSQALVIADVEYHGRVQSLLMLAFSGFGLMALPMGLLADQYGIRETMVLMAVLVGFSVLLGETWRRRQIQPDLSDF